MEQLCREMAEMKVQMGLFTLDMQALARDLELLTGENNQLKTQLGRVIEILKTVSSKESNPMYVAIVEVVIPSHHVGPLSSQKALRGFFPQSRVPGSFHQQPVLTSQINQKSKAHQQRQKKLRSQVCLPFWGTWPFC